MDYIWVTEVFNKGVTSRRRKECRYFRHLRPFPNLSRKSKLRIEEVTLSDNAHFEINKDRGKTLAKLSVEQALAIAKSHIKKGETKEAQTLYATILKAFPNNKEAQQGLIKWGSDQRSVAEQSPPQGVIDQLMSLYKQGRLELVVGQAKDLTTQFPKAIALWNMLGVSAAQIGKLDQAVQAFEQIISLNPNHANAHFNMGNALKDQGKLEKAIDAYSNALSLKPDYEAALNNVVVALKIKGKTGEKRLKKILKTYNKAQLIKNENANSYFSRAVNLQTRGKLEEAIEAYNKALDIKPDYAEAHYNMGIALQDQGKLEGAIKAYNKALAIKPDYAEGYYNMGIAFQDHGKLEEAIEVYNKALAIKPDYADAYNNMGNVLKDHGKLEEAIEAYNKALDIKPDYADAYNNMGHALIEQGKLEEAIEAYNKALDIKPDYADAYCNMGNALKDQSKLEEAIDAYNKALAIKPNYAEAYSNMGNALKDQGKPVEAIEAYNKALDIKPDYADALRNMGVAFMDQGKLEQAIEAYNKALDIKPDYAEVHENMSFALLNNGSLDEGLEKYEWRWKTDGNITRKRQFSRPMWDGKEILKGKKVLLWCEQGVGDTINWSSRLPLISAMAAHCILECPDKLVPLMARSFPNIEVKREDRNNDEYRNDFDYHLPLGSIYRHFVPEILKDVKPDAFLLPDPIRVEYWTKRLRSLGEGPYVGVSWKSADMSPKRLPNYAPLADWSPIFTTPSVTFINLQYTDFTDDLIEIQNKFGVTVHNFDDLNHFDDLDDVAALCAALDMVVSTKITVPLISAGVGTVTKLANWRQSSWNNILLNPVGPLVDMFEKNTSEPWHEVFSAISEDMMKL